MANTNKVVENFRDTNGLNQGDLAVLLAFKKQLSESISRSPDILNGRSSADEIMHSDPSKLATKDPLDYSFLNIVGRYVFDNGEKSPLNGQKELLSSFNKLPQNLQSLMKAQIAIFSDVKSHSEEQRVQQVETLKLAERVLGTSEGEPSFGDDKRLDINGETSRALRNYLEDMKNIGKIKQEFEPRIFDNSAKEALDELVSTLAKEAGVESYEINDLMIHLYSTEHSKSILFAGASAEDEAQIEALGKAVVMRDLMNMIVEGHTPSSENARGYKADAEINWDKPWSNHFSRDKFFGKGVYKALYQEQDSWGKTHLTTDILFRRRDYSDEQYDILTKAAKKALSITPDSPDREISEMEVGKIAIEIMKIRAEQVWCMEHSGEKFDPKQIHAMIHNKEFMPHLSDLKLVDAGLGVPPEFEPMAKELGVNSFQIQYEFEYPIRMHRIAKFQEMFGDLPDGAIKERAEYHKDNGQFWDETGKPDMNKLYGYVETTSGTPAYYFRPLGRSSLNMLSQYRQGDDPSLGYMTPTQYELDRQKYLERAQTIIEDGGCTPCARNTVNDARMQQFNEAAKDSGVSLDDSIKANRGECSIFEILKNQGTDDFLYEGKKVLDKKEAEAALDSLKTTP